MIIRCDECGKKLGEWTTHDETGTLYPVAHTEPGEWHERSFIDRGWPEDMIAYSALLGKGSYFWGSPYSGYTPFCNWHCRAKWMKREGYDNKRIQEAMSFVVYA